MEILTGVYLFFILATLYIYSFFLLILFKNRKTLFKHNLLDKNFPLLTLLVPAYNEEDNIAKTIKSLLNCKYPKDKLEIIVIDDGSKDKTVEIAKQFPVKLIQKQNTGKADSLNQGIKAAKGEFIGVVDADSYPEEDALLKVMDCFKDPEVAAVTSAIRVGNQQTFLGRLQAIEYTLIAWARKLLEHVNSVYVTPGPLSVYRAKIIKELEGFDHKILTEDIELAWRILKNRHYKIKMCLAARIFTKVPEKFKVWWRQRLRWDIGGLQTAYKHKHVFFSSKYGMVGLFVAPFFVSTFVLSLLGFSIFIYILIKRLLNAYLFTSNSLATESLTLQLKSIYLTPSVFTFFGIILFITYISYLILGLKIMDKTEVKIHKKLNIPLYLLFYLPLYPLIFIHSLYLILTNKIIKW